MEREGEGKVSKQRGEDVVLGSVRMSAFPLSGEGDHRLSMSVTPVVYASLPGRGKGRWVVGVCVCVCVCACVCVFGVAHVRMGAIWKRSVMLFSSPNESPFLSLGCFSSLHHSFFLFTVLPLLPCSSLTNTSCTVLPACVAAYCVVVLRTYTFLMLGSRFNWFGLRLHCLNHLLVRWWWFNL